MTTVPIKSTNSPSPIRLNVDTSPNYTRPRARTKDQKPDETRFGGGLLTPLRKDFVESVKRRASNVRHSGLGVFGEPVFRLKIVIPSDIEDKIFEVTPKELAKHLTMISCGHFKRLRRKELESVGWTGRNKEALAPSIVKMTRHFNSLALWIADEILNASKIKTRYQIINFFINTAYSCLKVDNLEGVKCIVSALQSVPIYRLERTWDMISRKEKDVFRRLEVISSVENNNEKYSPLNRYRQYLAMCKPPMIPYLGIALSDITYIYECLRKDKDNPSRRAQYKERQVQFEQQIDYIMNLQSKCSYEYSVDAALIDGLQQIYKIPNDDFNAAYERQYKQSIELENKAEVPSPVTSPTKESEWRIGSLRLSKRPTPDLTFKSLGSSTLPTANSSDNFNHVLTSVSPRKKLDSSMFMSPATMHSTLPLDDDEHPTLEIEQVKTPSEKSSKFKLSSMFNPFKKSHSLHARVKSKEESVDGTNLAGDYEVLTKLSPVKPMTADSVLEKSRLLDIQGEPLTKTVFKCDLLKLEEFDNDGQKSTEKDWKLYNFQLELNTLSIRDYLNTDKSKAGSPTIKTEGLKGDGKGDKLKSNMDRMKSHSANLLSPSKKTFIQDTSTASNISTESQDSADSMLSKIRRLRSQSNQLSFDSLNSQNTRDSGAFLIDSYKKQSPLVQNGLDSPKPNRKTLYASSLSHLAILSDKPKTQAEKHTSPTLLKSYEKLKAEEPDTQLIETINLNHLCRVNIVNNTKKKNVYRVLVGKNRSFLLRSENESDIETCINCIKLAIDKVNLAYSSIEVETVIDCSIAINTAWRINVVAETAFISHSIHRGAGLQG